MCGRLGEESGTQASEGVGTVGFDRGLCVQLTGDRFDDLADLVVEATDGCSDLFSLVFARLGEEADVVVGCRALAGHLGRDGGGVGAATWGWAV